MAVANAADTNVELIEGSEIQAGCEVFFPGRFTQQFPDGTMPKLPLEGRNTIIPVYKLSHGTHRKQAIDIRPNKKHPSEYIFKVEPKFPKKFLQGGTGKTQTYKYVGPGNKFEMIPSDKLVLPGKYSWWGVSVEDWYQSGLYKDGRDMKEKVLDHKKKRKYVAEYLQTNIPECPYGDIVFTVDLNDIEQCYIKSRTDVTDDAKKTVSFRFAGTFRYRLEICYVIIVSMVNDNAELGGFTTLDGPTDMFGYNSLTRENGVPGPTVRWFTLNHIIKCDASQAPQVPTKYHSWETPAFAFYFPKDVKEEISIPKHLGVVTELPTVRHNPRYCPQCS